MYFERFWRKATPQDAIKQPSMVARYVDDDGTKFPVGKRVTKIAEILNNLSILLTKTGISG